MKAYIYGVFLLSLILSIEANLVLSRAYYISTQWSFASPWSGYPTRTTFYDNGTFVTGDKPPVTGAWWWNSTVFMNVTNFINCQLPTVINSYHPGKNTDIVTLGYC